MPVFFIPVRDTLCFSLILSSKMHKSIDFPTVTMYYNLQIHLIFAGFFCVNLIASHKMQTEEKE